MKFATLPTINCAGLLLAHAQRLPDGQRLSKGLELGEAECQALDEAGISQLPVFALEAGDIDENQAAQALGRALNASDGSTFAADPIHGRVNLFASAAGLLKIDVDALDQFNSVDEGITLASLLTGDRVAAGQLIATIKIIPFAVADDLLARSIEIAARAFVLKVDAFRPRPVTLIQTRDAVINEKVLAKSERVLTERFKSYGVEANAITCLRCEHDRDALAECLSQLDRDTSRLTVILGATAITDRRDVIPAAVEAGGGKVLHLGLPVDPGNLLMLASLEGQPVIGAPGCARSPQLNGLDLLLDRLFADQPVDGSLLTGMGHGGLLKEDSQARLIPRQSKAERASAENVALKVAVAVLAGGHSRRMGNQDKLALPIEGGETLLSGALAHFEDAAVDWSQQLLVARADGPTRRRAGWTTVLTSGVTGQMSESLHAVARALNSNCSAVLIGLGDMPKVSTNTIEQLVAAFNPDGGVWAARPVHQGQVGNPVLIGERFFARLTSIDGDRGARQLLTQQSHLVADVEVDDPGILIDVDRPEDYDRLLTPQA